MATPGSSVSFRKRTKALRRFADSRVGVHWRVPRGSAASSCYQLSPSSPSTSDSAHLDGERRSEDSAANAIAQQFDAQNGIYAGRSDPLAIRQDDRRP